MTRADITVETYETGRGDYMIDIVRSGSETDGVTVDLPERKRDQNSRLRGGRQGPRAVCKAGKKDARDGRRPLRYYGGRRQKIKEING